ncbi:MAG TPA: quinolinate synthase NadA [Gammaproteobacteria bacterium]|nr:quinolinate synthase NadA [Gammaproteobacteria bacterium]
MDSFYHLRDEITELKKKHNAVILAHNYQAPDVQKISDYVGDSLGLARKAATTDADVIVFCGVHFMAETAAILNPDKTVLLPGIGAGCSLADMVDVRRIREWKEAHPDGLVVSYVNTTAAVKAESYVCCTSSNAVSVVNALPGGRPILFVPDFYLGAYVREKTGREMELWLGECHVHAGIRSADIDQAVEQYPDAELMVHPECGCTTGILFQRPELPLLSTSQMVDYAQRSKARQFLVATEVGILYQLAKQVPHKSFIPIRADAVCPYMKLTNCGNVRDTLRDLSNEVTVDAALVPRARAALERMFQAQPDKH